MNLNLKLVFNFNLQELDLYSVEVKHDGRRFMVACNNSSIIDDH